MAPRSSNSNTYRDGVKLDLERPKKNETHKVKVDISNINTKNVTHLGWDIKGRCKAVHEIINSNPTLCLE